MEQSGEIEKVKVFSGIFAGMLLVFVWAGSWALFGKIMIGKLSFFTHAGIFSLASICLSLMTVALGYLCYALGYDDQYSDSLLILSAVVFCWAIYAHMSYTTRLSSRAILGTCVVLTLVGMGWYLIDTQILESEFDHQPSYELVLKSPDYNFVDGRSLEDFFVDAERIQDVIAEVIKEEAY